jgi:hypothetical protein
VTIDWRWSALLTLAVAACAAALLVASPGGAGVVWSRPKWLPLTIAGSDRLWDVPSVPLRLVERLVSLAADIRRLSERAQKIPEMAVALRQLPGQTVDC